jgi:thiosulfate/3-mercaptopyruvate sulfurtransferase
VLPPFVDVDWVRTHVDEVSLVDVRWYLDGRSGREAHAAGHLPGAVFVDLDTDLAAPPSARDGRHPLPSPEDFAAAMERCGVGDGATVVAYDDAGGAIAARLVWMLRVLGERAAVLDGGVDAWPGPLERGEVAPSPASFTPRGWPAAALADADEVARLAAGGGVVVDARAPERYRGEHEPVDPRPGHVPGAVSRPYAGNLADGRLRDVDALRERYADLAGREVAVYCGSGVTACHDVLAMERAGVGARLYAGSWSAWSADPERPVALGAEPGAVGVDGA